MSKNVVGNGINATWEVVGVHNYFLSKDLVQMKHDFIK